MLKQLFFRLCANYSDNNILIETLWSELEQHYSDKKRYYHNLTHLDSLFFEVKDIENEIDNIDSFRFSGFYHDIIYNTQKGNNEEESAKLAGKRLKEIRVPDRKIETCQRQIIATKSHKEQKNFDDNLFIDADLSILGKKIEIYKVYLSQIKKEYYSVPKYLFDIGRKKVLKHFLDKEKIYKTDYFYEKYEKQARYNLIQELNSKI